ncbi:hypothetical protein AS9A_2252 [Hoyosella subflava DQS3-9A1]|uniref:Uncharacterized protein n=1 Tax=Hoyosella subflava (strain DSM 45089 / JCM 17490 / NBRC 109087 / DQS3-9A1) TaxID=443218 RepID=F6ER12_HOYSD|nr:hypothetical protein AS9A_2252 [Hoyosella subflava DQS3-9A1]
MVGLAAPPSRHHPSEYAKPLKRPDPSVISPANNAESNMQGYQ